METILPMAGALVIAALVLAGALITLSAAFGILRFPDLFTRMHAASKAGTVGSSLLLLAVGLHAGELHVLFRALAGVAFFVMTAPISAHLLAKAAHQTGYASAARPCAMISADKPQGRSAPMPGALSHDSSLLGDEGIVARKVT